jgi:hypothetical protein
MQSVSSELKVYSYARGFDGSFLFCFVLFCSDLTFCFGLLSFRPDPENHCFAASLFPGCTNETCLETVCVAHPSCCESQYGPICLETARQHGHVCRPPLTNNTCEETSAYGGCIDEECEASVCAIRSECCNGNTTIGEWSTVCLNIAEETCRG